MNNISIGGRPSVIFTSLSPIPESPLPSPARAAELLQQIRDVVVPLQEHQSDEETLLNDIFQRVTEMVADRNVAQRFIEELPEIIRLVRTDIEAIAENDPAATSVCEVALCYPATTAMIHYRTAHVLHQLGQPLLARIITEQAHSQTGIDIHPATTIGEAFAIDHGTGVVIGSTAIVGSHVTIYQGVTLGARHFTRGSDGRPAGMPRHPIVEDYVTIYSNTSVLGRVHIGSHAIIGGNLWITRDIPPRAIVRQQPPQQHPGFTDGAGI